MEFDRISLKALATILREGSFEAAAQKLGMTQPSISARIKHLEHRVGAQLVVRSRPCIATNYGQILARLGDQISYLEIETLRALEELGVETGQRPSIIKIAVNVDSLATWFPAVVKRAKDELNIFLDVRTDDQSLTAEHLQKGEVAGAISSNFVKIAGSQSQHLGNMAYVAVASPEFFGRYFATGVTAATLRTAPALIFSHDDTLVRRWLQGFAGASDFTEGHILPSFLGYHKALIHGAGWGMMPVLSVREAFHAGDLVPIARDAILEEPLLWHINARRSKIMGLLSRIVMEEAAQALALR